MGGINVKNTIIERLLQNVAPHLCFGCGKTGSVLCDYCKYDISNESFVGCILCGKPYLDGICKNHDSLIQKAYVITTRTGVTKALIDGLKFDYMKAAAQSAAELLNECLPLLPENTIIVPIPTVRSHVRQRGYDQVDLIAKHFAHLRGLSVFNLLERTGTATQHTLNRSDRLKEAKHAFSVKAKIPLVKPDTPLLIIDDIITTGSTVTEAAQALKHLSNTIWVTAIAYQPLD